MMTPEEAYAEGFCKVAEAAGIDPEYLVKEAFLGGARGINSALRGLSSFGRAAGEAFKALRPALGRTIGGIKGQGFGSALKDLGSLRGESARYAGQLVPGAIKDVARGVRTNARWSARNLRNAVRSAANAVGEAVEAGMNRGRSAINGFNNYLGKHPVAAGMVGGALGNAGYDALKGMANPETNNSNTGSNTGSNTQYQNPYQHMFAPRWMMPGNYNLWRNAPYMSGTGQ